MAFLLTNKVTLSYLNLFCTFHKKTLGCEAYSWGMKKLCIGRWLLCSCPKLVRVTQSAGTICPGLITSSKYHPEKIMFSKRVFTASKPKFMCLPSISSMGKVISRQNPWPTVIYNYTRKLCEMHMVFKNTRRYSTLRGFS